MFNIQGLGTVSLSESEGEAIGSNRPGLRKMQPKCGCSDAILLVSFLACCTIASLGAAKVIKIGSNVIAGLYGASVIPFVLEVLNVKVLKKLSEVPSVNNVVIESFESKENSSDDKPSEPLVNRAVEVLDPPSLTLPREMERVVRRMQEDGCVMQADRPIYLYTDFLGPCVAGIAKCRLSDDTLLIGVTHFWAESSDFSDFHRVRRPYYKLCDLIDKFKVQPGYKGETIELYLAGGCCASPFDISWREILVLHVKSIPQVELSGTYFNPYNCNEEIEKERQKIEHTNQQKRFYFCLREAGITHEGNVILHKSHNIDFQGNIDTFLSFQEQLFIEYPPWQKNFI